MDMIWSLNHFCNQLFKKVNIIPQPYHPFAHGSEGPKEEGSIKREGSEENIKDIWNLKFREGFGRRGLYSQIARQACMVVERGQI